MLNQKQKKLQQGDKYEIWGMGEVRWLVLIKEQEKEERLLSLLPTLCEANYYKLLSYSLLEDAVVQWLIGNECNLVTKSPNNLQ